MFENLAGIDTEGVNLCLNLSHVCWLVNRVKPEQRSNLEEENV